MIELLGTQRGIAMRSAVIYLGTLLIYDCWTGLELICVCLSSDAVDTGRLDGTGIDLCVFIMGLY